METQEKQTILWIHGFAGSPNNATVQEMRKCYPGWEWYAIEVNHHALDSMQRINDYLHSHRVDMVAGTSLGGFYALCADFDGPKLVINPGVNPMRELRQFIGTNTYKPGREDGQTTFEFTEADMEEFAQLKMAPLYNVMCHYTAHDQVLGEDVKDDYKRVFYRLEEMSEHDLPGHFMTFRYVKGPLGKVLNSLPYNTIDPVRDLYHFFGKDGLLLPDNLRPVACMAERLFYGSFNLPKLLKEIEG